MKIQIFVKVQANVPITFDQIKHIMTCARMHYDHHCKMSAEVGGFIYGWWNNFWPHAEKSDLDEQILTMDSREMDTVFKILEMHGDFKSGDIRRLLRVVKMHMDEVSPQWQKEIEI